MSINDTSTPASASALASATPVPVPVPAPTPAPAPITITIPASATVPRSNKRSPRGKDALNRGGGGGGDVEMDEGVEKGTSNGHVNGNGDDVVMSTDSPTPASKSHTSAVAAGQSRPGTPVMNGSAGAGDVGGSGRGGGGGSVGRSGRKRKVSDETPNAKSTRSTRSRLHTPSVHASPASTSQHRAPPPPQPEVGQPTRDDTLLPDPSLDTTTANTANNSNNPSSKAPSPAPLSETDPTLTPAPASASAPATGSGGLNEETDPIRLEAAAGYESRLRARVPGGGGGNAKKDGAGHKIGVSASGRDVRIGGSARQAATALKKDKGKGKGDVVQPNQDFCSACRGIGRFLCCDGCPRSFHFMCLEPPLRLDELPEEERWLCKHCRSENAKEEDPTPKKQKDLPAIPSVFRALSDKIEDENPEQFRLPTEVRKFFAGVSTGAEGEYVDAKSGRAKIDRKGFLEDRDPFRLRDGRQKKVACFHCGGSSLPKHSVLTDPEATWRQMISCDYCPSSWHLDCLSPPPSIMPSAGRKWMCPNHPEHVMPKRRTLNEGLEIIDISKPGQLNNGNIEIIVPETTAIGKDGKQFEFEDMVINRKKFRVPEKVVKLDFWNKIQRGKSEGKGKGREVNGDEMEVDEDEAEPEMDDINAAAMMMALAFSRHTAPPVASTRSETAVEKEREAGTAEQPNEHISAAPSLPESGAAMPESGAAMTQVGSPAPSA
ncbi:nuclear protein [Cryptococcus wingfieldii CBS 7118]|uniref:Nuclear protein n=1 Tax=Cryptococcus wingfieldii CBS 7118 TaxID=1295528 RepID=A0A1E3IQD1_9TREE|nr:nuclear protein [Cryptococcus wingfieldii CBS 7118]ODN90817.1 nuclear protein [Cryptococcus wingfieldii CBS 7118]